jgi:Holliday junction resolvase RusA-like endonuclease
MIHTPATGLTNDYTDSPVTRTLVAQFTVPGEPVSKARARVTSRGAFTPQKTRDAEALVAATYRASPHPTRLFEKSDKYELEVTFYLGSLRQRDSDNMAKLVADALNKIAYDDDSQIIDMHIYKRNTLKSAARTEVTLWLLT